MPAMRVFVIEAYGGPNATDSKIEHFRVLADKLDAALALIRKSPDGAHYSRFDLIEESGEFGAGEARILDPGDGPYPRP
jgi:hypothetical protein